MYTVDGFATGIINGVEIGESHIAAGSVVDVGDNVLGDMEPAGDNTVASHSAAQCVVEVAGSGKGDVAPCQRQSVPADGTVIETGDGGEDR